jgi:hypothetical protein
LSDSAAAARSVDIKLAANPANPLSRCNDRHQQGLRRAAKNGMSYRQKLTGKYVHKILDGDLGMSPMIGWRPPSSNFPAITHRFCLGHQTSPNCCFG